ncbi:MAG TPA: Gfo/Idh/MocA family oxidoreductase [Candidatus Latescibacteria bacterium]|nr:Gfo/Idh/MocA family oxidoreductase [Candidatus Latescibacterota bacterium]HOF62036.1 Gfo/Idh/MocA family oxidoreductase [Candidatus Latescibacterota bacterium]HOS65227.1 Gfo/Idh/MocA family oxidoreductase [Candidatus Latescibacterota bacterium]HPK74962.1 Gfo/Idh/MocA family oxidoreductase [Candidatus Latescibacterota bacterium]
MADKIRMGFIGCGFMGQLAHIANYARLHDECDLVAVADVRPLLAKKVAARYGIRETYTDHRELLEKADVDAVAAIMYYGHHYAVVPDVIESGRHLITEKPMACSASSARKWKAAADAKRLVYMVGYMKRWDLGARWVSDIVRQWKTTNEFGEFNHLRCLMSGTDWTWNPYPVISSDEQPVASLPPHEPFPARFTKAQADYFNMNINFYVHQVNLMRFLLDEQITLSYCHPAGKILIGSTESGKAVSLEMGISSIPQTWDEVYQIAFEKADIELRMPAPLRGQHNGEVVVRRTVNGKTYETLRPNFPVPSWSFFEQAKGFLEAVRTGRLPFDSTGDAVRDLEFFETQADMMQGEGGVARK